MSAWPPSRVGQYARRVGELLGLGEPTLSMLEAAGSLHDAGKYFLSGALLEKPGALDPAEWEAIHRHPELGAAVARRDGHGEEVQEWIAKSHERPDGSGYPDGLRGEAIPLGARIVAVIDAYVGMTSPRADRPALSPEAALAELEGGAGTAFSAEVVGVFCELVRANLPRR